METEQVRRPSWDQLFEFAVAQAGLFTTKQAAEAGYSPQLLVHYLRIRRIVRVQRGVYRLVHYPLADDEQYVMLWLWSEQQGVFSHQTALRMQGLSDVLPSRIDMTLPLAWKKRRLRVPSELILHYADLPKTDRTWWSSVPMTNTRRTLSDNAAAHLSPEFLLQAFHQALYRGKVARSDIQDVEQVLKPYLEPA
ncbi:type IV toxin-antitoxin system AbiEi family antitoxin domain-containing protein [Pyxidicoccus parkwayensis]|uniref:Type IV toxin-antitoxin system AbiEi family antitoxin domain-containing protein n=1 Tax=Pyxidicoccus parkwayensis TaxID=2813578 RepID=A0ABX7NVY7_9BACT|nr:type IV toxin-antitoxin system AbiEi family antitoxin domain-containing protein [Pyxidicoccus parkwaysis]QSQ21559.1 type IV toxin-antitoxin system AbiEi family antitoxin domain-containing protein [Pyxidicoccus parkwaysis]